MNQGLVNKRVMGLGFWGLRFSGKLLRIRFAPLSSPAVVALALVAITSSTTVSIAAPEAAAATTESTEKVGAPIALKKFTKKKVRTGSAKSGKASLAQRAKAGKRAEKYAARKGKTKPVAEMEDVPAASASGKLAPKIANANAQLMKPDDGANAAALNPYPGTATDTSAAQADTMQVAEAAEINDIDKAAWAPKDVPKLSPAVLDSRAEMREDESRWASTSTIGKIFVAIGALLTFGSAIRMFIA